MTGSYVVNVEAAICRGDSWLIIERSAAEQHAGGLLAMPGGTVEDTDTDLEECVRREVLEEVGVQLSARLEYVESKLFYSARGRWVINIVFLAEYAAGEPLVQDLAEVAAVAWRTYAEIVAQTNTPTWLESSLTAAHRRRTDLGWPRQEGIDNR